MRKLKKPKIGEYVLVTNWGDRDPFDPWHVGTLEKILQNGSTWNYKVKEYPRWFFHCWKITAEEGLEIIENYRKHIRIPSRGGKREGSGGGKPCLPTELKLKTRSIRMRDDEYIKVKEFLKELRKQERI